MTASDGADIEEGEDVVGIEHDIRRRVAGDDPAEDAVVHAGHSSLDRSL